MGVFQMCFQVQLFNISDDVMNEVWEARDTGTGS